MGNGGVVGFRTGPHPALQRRALSWPVSGRDAGDVTFLTKAVNRPASAWLFFITVTLLRRSLEDSRSPFARKRPVFGAGSLSAFLEASAKTRQGSPECALLSGVVAESCEPVSPA